MKNALSSSKYRCIPIFIVAIVSIALQISNVQAVSLPGKIFSSSSHTFTKMVSDNHYLWLGTWGEGLLRVDKNSNETVVYTTSNSGLTDNYIRALTFDKDGTLLIGTPHSGIISFDGTRWKIISGLLDNTNVFDLAVDSQGEIWAWMQSTGVVRYTNGTWQPVINRFAGVITTTPAGNIWTLSAPSNPSVDCNDGSVQEYVNGGLQSTISLVPVCSEIVYPHFLAVDNKKNCWIGSQNVLIKIFGQSINRFYTGNDSTLHKNITALAVNSNGVLLTAVSDYSGTSEIFIYDQYKGGGQPFDSSVVTLNVNSITTACADPSTGGFWCAASDGSIIKIDQSNHVSVIKTGNSLLPSNIITSLLSDKTNSIWVATDVGIARYYKYSNMPQQWTTYPTSQDSMPGKEVSSLALDSSGIIWAGFSQPLISQSIKSGLSYFSEGRWRNLVRTYISVKAITIDKNGDLWVVSDRGLSRFHDKQSEVLFETKSSSDETIALGTMVNAVAIDSSNTPWIGTGLGIKRYVNEAWIEDTTIKPFLPKTGISSKGINVNTISFLNDTMWIGTSLGLFKRTGNNCTHIDTTDSFLPDLNVQCITTDGPNGVWIGTKRGLVHIKGQNHKTYTSQNILLNDNDITSCAVAKDSSIWIGTRLGGLTVLDRSEVNDDSGAVSTIPNITKGKSNLQLNVISYNNTQLHTYSISILTSRPGAVSFSVVSLQGKLIRRFIGKSAGVQVVTFVWNGTDRFNKPVSNGLYLGIASINDKIIGRKILSR